MSFPSRVENYSNGLLNCGERMPVKYLPLSKLVCKSRLAFVFLFLTASVVAVLDTSCVMIRNVYDLESFTPKSTALADANPTTRSVVSTHASLSSEIEHWARDHKSMEVDGAGVLVHCFPAVQSVDIQEPVNCALIITNNTLQDITIDEQSIVLANDLLIGGARKRNPRLVQCEIARVPLRPIRPGEELPILMEFEKDNTKRKSRLQFTIRTGDGKDLTYEFTFKGKNK